MRKSDLPQVTITEFTLRSDSNEISDKPYYVEFSTGCITFICSEDYSIAELIGQADKCLYEAKRTRRQNVKK